MSAQLLYVELKSGHSDNGPAWIGKGEFNRSRRTLYFNGLVLRRAHGIDGNHIEVETADSYWVSGVKKDGADRHKCGGGKIFIDENVVSEYLKLRSLEKLPTHGYEAIRLDDEPRRHRLNSIENSII